MESQTNGVDTLKRLAENASLFLFIYLGSQAGNKPLSYTMTNETEKLGYILLVAVSTPFGNHDPYWWIGTVLCILAAYSLRIMGDIRDKDFTWTSAGIQLVTTVSLDILAYFIWKDNPAVRRFSIFGFQLFFGSFQIYIFAVSYFSFAIVTLGTKIGNYGFENAWLKIKAVISASNTPPTPPQPPTT